MRFKLADPIRFAQNKIKDNYCMGISFSQCVILSKTKNSKPLIKVTVSEDYFIYLLRQIMLLLKDTN